MKHGRKLTRKEKQLLKSEEHNPKDYLRVKKTAENYTFIHRTTGEIVPIRY